MSMETKEAESVAQVETADGSLLDEVLAALASGRRGKRQDAREKVLDMAEPGSVWHDDLDKRLEALARSGNAFARGTGYLALATSRPETAAEVLATMLEEGEADARTDLTIALARLGNPARTSLARLLKDDFFEIRFAAAQGLLDCEGLELGQEEKDGCFLALKEGLGFDDTRYEAIAGLHKLGDPRALEPVKAVFGKFFVSGFERTAAAGVLAKLGDRSGIEFLCGEIVQKKGMHRGLAFELIGELRLAEAGERVLAVANDRKNLFRGAALKALGAMGHPDALKTLAPVVTATYEEDDVRAFAAEGLSFVDAPESRKALGEALRDIRLERDRKGESHRDLDEAICQSLTALEDASRNQGKDEE